MSQVLSLRGSPSRASDHKEQYHHAWINAIAGVTGCIVWKADVVDDGIDAILEHKHKLHVNNGSKSVHVNVQLKATEKRPTKNHLTVYPTAKRFNEYIVPNPGIPIMVAALRLPKDPGDWVKMRPEGLLLNSLCYWVNLEGAPKSTKTGKTKVPVKVPTSQILDDGELLRIMHRLGQGGAL